MSDEGFDVVFASLLGFDEWEMGVEWSRRHFALMGDGGMWGVPRSGLIFRRAGDFLILHAVMPYMEEMVGTVTPEQLHEQQVAEYETIAAYFEAAGVPVRGRELLDEEENDGEA
jgi:hypothetical protein